jgi:hypothetical protein
LIGPRGINPEEAKMREKKLRMRWLVVAVACLAIMLEASVTALAQPGGSSTKKTRAKRTSPRKSAKAALRPKAGIEEKTVADRIVLRDGKELLGQIDVSSTDATLAVVARRELVRSALPDWIGKWEDAEKSSTVGAELERRERLMVWRQERPAEGVPQDRITAWLDHELTKPPGRVTPSTLMAIRLTRDEVKAMERRSEVAAHMLRCAWLLGLANPETANPAGLNDLIAGRGMSIDSDEPIAVDGLLPLAAEPFDRWLLRRAATEALYDDGLRFIAFGNTVLWEPLPGQPLDRGAGMALVEGTIRDVLGVGGANALPLRFREVAARGRVGIIVTRIEVAGDFASASAESTLFCRNKNGWQRALWRSQNLEVGAVPPIVVSMVAADPQVKAVMNLIDSIGAGFVSPDMKERGLAVGATVGGAVVLARTALVRSLAGLSFDIEGKSISRGIRSKP